MAAQNKLRGIVRMLDGEDVTIKVTGNKFPVSGKLIADRFNEILELETALGNLQIDLSRYLIISVTAHEFKQAVLVVESF